MAIALVGCAASAASFAPPAGAFDPTATAAQTCAPGFTRTQRVRDTYALRDRVYNAYGLARGHRAGLYVIDHLIPISLGGVTTEPNLWPQTRAQAARKDQDEFRLHAAVCSGRVTLADARTEMLRLWGRSSR